MKIVDAIYFQNIGHKMPKNVILRQILKKIRGKKIGFLWKMKKTQKAQSPATEPPLTRSHRSAARSQYFEQLQLFFALLPASSGASIIIEMDVPIYTESPKSTAQLLWKPRLFGFGERTRGGYTIFHARCRKNSRKNAQNVKLYKGYILLCVGFDSSFVCTVVPFFFFFFFSKLLFRNTIMK